MGYYTRFELDYEPYSDEVSEAVADSDELNYPIVEGDSCKWYDHESDMREFSKRFPDVLFKLSGYGEESGDIWVKYFKNGLTQHCPAKITFDDFDESKLK